MTLGRECNAINISINNNSFSRFSSKLLKRKIWLIGYSILNRFSNTYIETVHGAYLEGLPHMIYMTIQNIKEKRPIILAWVHFILLFSFFNYFY